MDDVDASMEDVDAPMDGVDAPMDTGYSTCTNVHVLIYKCPLAYMHSYGGTVIAVVPVYKLKAAETAACQPSRLFSYL